MDDDVRKREEQQQKESEEQTKKAAEEKKRLAEEVKNHVINILQSMGETEKQTELERRNQFEQFLSSRLEAQVQYLSQENDAVKLSGEERIAYLQEQGDLILANEKLNKEERISAIKALNNMIIKEEESVKKRKELIQRQSFATTAGLMGSLSDLLALAGEDNYAAAVASRALASAEALINSYLAFTQVLANPLEGPSWVRIAAAATVLAAGLAQQIKIFSTPIPSSGGGGKAASAAKSASGETGGRFIVPHSVGSDASFMRVNSDEVVDITPRGMTGFNGTQRIIVQIDKQPLFDVMNEGIRSGDVIISAANF
jgi:hypothetical protein